MIPRTTMRSRGLSDGMTCIVRTRTRPHAPAHTCTRAEQYHTLLFLSIIQACWLEAQFLSYRTWDIENKEEAGKGRAGTQSVSSRLPSDPSLPLFFPRSRSPSLTRLMQVCMEEFKMYAPPQATISSSSLFASLYCRLLLLESVVWSSRCTKIPGNFFQFQLHVIVVVSIRFFILL